jgi:hypothetical protein
MGGGRGRGWQVTVVNTRERENERKEIFIVEYDEK